MLEDIEQERLPLMITAGIVLVVIGAVLNIPLVYSLGVLGIVVGAVLWLLGSFGRAVGGRRHFY